MAKKEKEKAVQAKELYSEQLGGKRELFKELW